jgi:DNA polymerase IV
MSAEQRWIIHVDLDAFFASVEELLNPDLRGKPLIVGGDPRYRGVVSSASYAARAYGVRSAMPVAQALRLCPQAILVPPRHGEYGKYSRAVMDILHSITPLVEQVSIDEAFLDVTGCEHLWGPVTKIAQMIQQRVLAEQQLSVSLGIATNKLVAKIACDWGKPHGLVLVKAGEEQAFIAPLAVEKLWGVGKVTGDRLRALGVRTIGDLATWSEERLVTLFGEGGHGLYWGARGVDHSHVAVSREQRSISKEYTFGRDTAHRETIHRMVLQMSEAVASTLRAEHLVAQTVRIKLRFPDFTTITRQMALAQPTDQGQIVRAAARQLLDEHWRAGQPLRLLGVAVSGLWEGGGYQLSLLDQTDQRRIRLNQTLDEIRGRFGRKAITRASLLAERHTEETDADEGGEP